MADSSKPKNDLEKANQLKEEANALVKAGKFGEGCERYFEAINTLRFSEKFKASAEGRQAEMACRLNIALCKQNMGDYQAVVDQCERVLAYEEGSWKAQFRMSQALYQMVKAKGVLLL